MSENNRVLAFAKEAGIHIGLLFVAVPVAAILLTPMIQPLVIGGGDTWFVFTSIAKIMFGTALGWLMWGRKSK